MTIVSNNFEMQTENLPQIFRCAITGRIALICSIFFSGAFLLRRDNSRKQVFLVIATWLIMGLYTNVGIEQIVIKVLSTPYRNM